jgi:hypothetical protein
MQKHVRNAQVDVKTLQIHVKFLHNFKSKTPQTTRFCQSKPIPNRFQNEIAQKLKKKLQISKSSFLKSEGQTRLSANSKKKNVSAS